MLSSKYMWKRSRSESNDRFARALPWFVGAITVLLYVSPWIRSGENGYVRIHDGLDSLLTWHKIMAEEGFWLSSYDTLVGPITDQGMLRFAYPSEYLVTTWLFAFFSPYAAYVLNQILLRLVAFAGMYLFLSQILQSNSRQTILVAMGAAISFACLPFWSWTGSVAAIPLFFHILLRAWNGKLGCAEIMALLVYASYSSTVLTGMFLIGISWLVTSFAVARRQPYTKLLLLSTLTTLIHLVVDQKLWFYLIYGGIELHRKEFKVPRLSLEESFSSSIRFFLHGDFAASLQNPVILSTVLTALTGLASLAIYNSVPKVRQLIANLLVMLKLSQSISKHIHFQIFFFLLYFGIASISSVAILRYQQFLGKYIDLINLKIAFKSPILLVLLLVCVAGVMISNLVRPTQQPNVSLTSRVTTTNLQLYLLVSIIIAVILSLLTGFWNWSPVVAGYQKFSLLAQVNLGRVGFFLSFVWALAFAISLLILVRLLPGSGTALASFFISLQLTVCIAKHEFFTEKNYSGISYKEFYAEGLFEKISAVLPKDKKSFMVASIGLHPSIAQYNGFRTVDGYLAVYPLEYKHKFRAVIASELERNEDLKSYFDDWGSRFYLFSSEMMCPRNNAFCKKFKSDYRIKINLDIQALRSLGTEYIFSIPTIMNANAMGLSELGTFNDANSAWEIKVYKLPQCETVGKSDETRKPSSQKND